MAFLTGSFSVGRARVIAGLLCLAITAGYIVMLAGLPFGRIDQPGAAVFPSVVAAVMLVASIVTIADGREMMRSGEDERADFPRAKPVLKMLVLLGTLIFYALTLRLLGRVIGTYIACAIILLVFAERGRIWPLLHAAWITAFVWFLFIRTFSLPLPRGVILDL